ncbi:MAG: 6-carboxytetrahydropterin synthase [candidate division Zixibacteria bacterium]|nr:6-carboxytetrahydropterin synthase [candidate division Zixibacteria bacterium]
MAKVRITRAEEFSASHILYSQGLSEHENRKIFGKCANPNGHGHNYRIEVTLRGEPNSDTGMVFNLSDLKRIIREEIIDKVDHKNLNKDVDFLRGIVPTAENLAVKFYEILKAKIPENLLYEVKLIETPRNWAVYRGEVDD